MMWNNDGQKNWQDEQSLKKTIEEVIEGREARKLFFSLLTPFFLSPNRRVCFVFLCFYFSFDDENNNEKITNKTKEAKKRNIKLWKKANMIKYQFLWINVNWFGRFTTNLWLNKTLFIKLLKKDRKLKYSMHFSPLHRYYMVFIIILL